MTITINHNHYFHNGNVIESEILKQLSIIQKQQNLIMESNKDLNDKLDALQSTVDTVQQQLSDANAAKDVLIAQQASQLEALTAAKAALESELANSVTPDQTAAAIAKIDATIADIQSTIQPTPPTV